MRTISNLKARFPKMFRVAYAALAIGAVGGIAAYERSSQADCCYPGSPCCHPGAPCCNGHNHVAMK